MAILYGKVEADLAVTGRGPLQPRRAFKAMMAEARVAMTTSALLQNGVGQAGDHILAELAEWMEENGYESVRQMQGSMSMRSGRRPRRVRARPAT